MVIAAACSPGGGAGFMPGMSGTGSATSTGVTGDEDAADDESAGKLDVSGGGMAEGGMADGGPPGCNNALIGVLRDFHETHPDFERDQVGEDYGIVGPLLGDDDKPVYAGGSSGTTTDQASFDQWFRDVDGVNLALPIKVTLAPEGDDSYVFDDRYFFPADDEGFGNEGRDHNYHFTVEIHASFEYRGGEVFTFRGDDDLFTYVNGHLGIDLGGVHLPLTRTIDMDAVADEFGLEIGNNYSLDFFFAERHSTLSNFRIETSIQCFTPVG